jgi:hypothetical protein
LEIGVSDKEYVDETTFTFKTREDCELITSAIVKHFAHWGLEVHVVSNCSDSTFVVLFCAKDRRCYTNPTDYDCANLSPVSWEGGCYIAVVDKIKYLGSYLTINGTDEYDVDSRIVSDGSAFGALHKCIFLYCNIAALAKRLVYISIILSIHLYGSECWSLTETILAKLMVLHN